MKEPVSSFEEDRQHCWFIFLEVIAPNENYMNFWKMINWLMIYHW
jgi:hypothetical protein